MVDYNAIYKALEVRKGRVITASQIAYTIGADKVYGATMSKLVRDGYLETCPKKGFYRVI